MRVFPLLLTAAVLAGCGEPKATVDDMNTIALTLPDGQALQVETMIDQRDVMRGMMFRTSMKANHGMLFFYRGTGIYRHYMYQTLIPLDMIWIDADKRIVEIVPNAPPCKTQASKCPVYGGHEPAKYVLELAGGMAEKHGVKVGQQVQF